MSNAPIFDGFSEPTENWYRLPNDWFGIWNRVRQEYGTRFSPLLKMTEYVLKHTWGAGRFNGQVQLSASEIRFGRRITKNQRLDHGTGISPNSVQNAGNILSKFGLLDVEQDNRDQARRLRTYLPRIKIQQDRAKIDESFSGFSPPQQNYFKVPKAWTDITCNLKSAATILAIEYLIRHAWGFHNTHGIWLTAEEISSGRRYSDGRRYDEGTGFDVSTIHRALKEALSLGLVVWAEKYEAGVTIRLYNLRLRGMQVGLRGQYSGHIPWEPEETSDDNEVVSGLIENNPIDVDDDTSDANEDASDTKEDVDGTTEARSGGRHTLTNTNKKHSFKTPSSAQQYQKRKKHKSKSVHGDDGSNISALPDDLLDMLQEMGWNDSLGIIQKYYANNPERVIAWAKCALEKPGLTRHAGYFRKRLLSGEPAPKRKTKESQTTDRNRYVSGEYADFLD